MTKTTHVDGLVAPGFEEVRAEFERNFAERGEIGAAFAAYWRGEKVVDLWGGRRTPAGDAPWNQDTMVVVMSSTKGLAAMTLAVANSRRWLDYDAPVARYWPDFAQNGKAAITVRQLLGHEAGLVLLDEKLTIEKLRDLDYLARLLARQKPAWPPGTRHGYHAMSLGLYMQEIVRRVDPARRTLGRFFRDEIAVPLDLEFHIGLPPAIPDDRLAVLRTLSRTRALLALPNTPPALLMKVLLPCSLLRRSMLLAGLDMNDRRSLEVELPAGNGVGTARAIARAYSAFAEGGAEIGITPETFARVTAPPEVARRVDEVLGVPSCFSLGFLRPGHELFFGSSARAFGSPGAGGSFGFADPDARVGLAYVMNKMDFYLQDDPREKALRDAVYRAIARLTAGSRAVEMVGASTSRAVPLKPLRIVWQRLVDSSGRTCARCGATHEALDRAVRKLTVALAPVGLEPVLETRHIEASAFKDDPSASNRIWIGGRPLEDWLGARTGSSPCCSVCGGAECRTVELGGSIFEGVPEELILRAALVAAGQALAPCQPPTQPGGRDPCSLECCPPQENSVSRRPQG